MIKLPRRLRRICIAIAGGAVTIVGVILIPYPGPGWVVVFAGLAIWATEYDWARRLLERLRTFYDDWQEWLKRQPWYVRLTVLAGVVGVVLITMWLTNVFGLVARLLHIKIAWLHSPIVGK